MPESEVITLRNKAAEATVSVQGAWLQSLKVENQDILYPRRAFTLDDGSVKQRGGCHVCLPNFGPGGEVGLAQHGFGRELPWEVVEKTDNTVELLLEGGSEVYAGLESRLTYELAVDGITMRLRAVNKGEAPLRVSPGFHPYFQTNDSSIHVGDREISTSQPYDTEFLTATPSEVRIGNVAYQVESENLPQWVAWTDHLGSYFCVEPTQAGYAFLQPPTESELLQPGVSREWSLTLTVG